MHPEFAAVQGWRVGPLDFALMILLTATTVIGLPAVGVVLMVAMLILPGASARFWSDRLGVVLVIVFYARKFRRLRRGSRSAK